LLQWTKTLGDVAMAEFIALAAMALWQWQRHRTRGAGWAALSFSALASIGIASKVMTSQGMLLPPLAVIKLLVATLLLVPFCLYRFAATFSAPPRWVRVGALVLTAGALAWTALLPYFPFPGTPQPAWFHTYRIGVSLQWGFLFTFVAVRMWTAGRNQPPATRDRMRMLAAGAAGLDVQVIVGMLGLSTRPGVAFVSAMVTVVMAALFSLGLVVPRSIRAWWQRHDRQAIQAAMGDLVGATSPSEVANGLLPHVAAFVGASRAALVDHNGSMVAVFGEPTPHEDAVELRFGRGGELVVWTNPYMSFFGRTELGMLEGIGHLLGLVMDRFAIAERERDAQNALTYQALHDDLTGLPNRALFVERLHSAAESARERDTSVAVMFIDLDRFKLINDGIDHAAGDAVLRTTAARLAAILRTHDTVARFGGDEFVVLAEVRDETEALILAGRLREQINGPMVIGGRELSVTASIGVVLGRRQIDPTALVRDADAAMYRAKDAGRDRVEIFSENVRTRARDRLDMERELRAAIGSDQIRLMYQPIVDLHNRQLIGFEALVRWHHPERGLLLPARFVPLAEESDLIVALDMWVLNEAVRQAANWKAANPGNDFTMWINMSAGLFHRAEPAAAVRKALSEAGLQPGSLGVEITESLFMSGTTRIGAAVRDLKKVGVSIAIDDFGTGFSSLGYLKRFPVDVLKIDMSFVRGIGSEPETSLVTACLALAASLGIDTVAEGVETAEHEAWLRNAGCAHGQGFGFSRPLEPADAGNLLAAEFVGVTAA
jgi:diguanylate cyclase (GGDEF)-like protein